jgi:hypothetical protein
MAYSHVPHPSQTLSQVTFTITKRRISKEYHTWKGSAVLVDYWQIG